MGSSRLQRAFIKAAIILFVVCVGLNHGAQYWGEAYRSRWDDNAADLGFFLYWSGASLLSITLIFGGLARSVLAYLRFQARAKRVLPGLGKERSALLQATTAIHQEREERAIAHLEPLHDANVHEDVRATARWLNALACVQFLRRNRRLLSSYSASFPQLKGLFFSHGRAPLRKAMLSSELEEVDASALDEMLKSYIEIVDRMIKSIDEPSMLFHTHAEQVLEYLTGRSYVFGAKTRFEAWWEALRPVLLRGGGPLYAGVRLIQREQYQEAVTLLQRLGADGLLAGQTETVGRMAAFFVMLARPQWRLSNEDLPRFFRNVYYHGCLEMGVLRYPAAALPEVVEGCKRGRDLRAQKKTFIEDAFGLWEAFGEELSGPLSVLLKRLLNHTGRPCPTRMSYWRKEWDRAKAHFEDSVVRVMDGITAAAQGKRDAAQAAFEKALLEDPSSSTPLVNQVYLRLIELDDQGAHRLASEVLKRFPEDGGAFVSLGRMFATHLEDTETAERLFRRARELNRSAIEPLICLGEIKLMEGKYNESQAYFDAAKAIDATSPEAKLGLARTYMETKRYKLAIDNLLPVARDSCGDAQHIAHYLLYRAYRDMSDHQVAIDYLDKVPTPFFKEPDLLDDIAFHLESEKHYAKARAFSERAMVLRAKGIERGDGLETIGEI